MKSKEVVATVLLSSAMLFGSVSAVHATELNLSPSPTPVAVPSPTSDAAQIAAYKAALVAYQAAMDVYKSEWKTTLDQYNAAVKQAQADFKAALALRKSQRAVINAAFQDAIAKARAEKKAVDKKATSVDQKSAAQTLLTAAISAAAITRQNALDALGPEPTGPNLPAKPIKPAEPVKPTPPTLSNSTLKQSPTSKATRLKKK